MQPAALRRAGTPGTEPQGHPPKEAAIMSARIKIGIACVVFPSLLAGLASAGSFSVTVSPASQSGGWTGTTFLASNAPPVPLGQTLPNCHYANNPCDKVTVTVANVTQAYLDEHPDQRIIFLIDWP